MMARPIAVFGALALALTADAACAQDVRALISEQQAFVRSLARGREQNTVWLVEWRNEALARRDGTATGGLSSADVQHFNTHRGQVPRLQFLAWAEGNDPGLRTQIDRAFVAVVTPVQVTRHTGTSQQFLQSTVEPRKNAEVRQLLDLLHRATARLSREASARGLPQPLVAGATAALPAAPPIAAAPPVAGTGGSLLGVGGAVAGRALPGGYVPPAGLPVPAQPPVLAGPTAWPGQTPFPPNQNVTITIDPRTLQQLLQLVLWMQRSGQLPGMQMPAGTGYGGPVAWPGQQMLPNPGQFGTPTGSYWDQAMRGQGIRIIVR